MNSNDQLFYIRERSREDDSKEGSKNASSMNIMIENLQKDEEVKLTERTFISTQTNNEAEDIDEAEVTVEANVANDDLDPGQAKVYNNEVLYMFNNR
jgi:hypothetical protein